MDILFSLFYLIVVYYLIKNFIIKKKFKKKFKKYNQKRYLNLDISNPYNQIKLISNKNIEFKAYKPINKEAFKVFLEIEKLLKKSYPNYRIFAETTLASFIKISPLYRMNTNDIENIYRAYCSKRVDFLIIDSFGNPALAIEYHGTGHGVDNKSIIRDQVKNNVLELANIKLLEVNYHNFNKNKLIEDVNYFLKEYISSKYQNNK